MRALDLFCGAGGATKGLQRAGFHVTGVDINPQPRYCGDAFIQADAMKFPLCGFDFVWASPPCQRYTNAQKIRGREHPNLISPLRDKLGNWPPSVIENVVGAPLLGPVMLCGAMFGLRTYRHRLFECSWSFSQLPEHPEHAAPTVKMGRPPREGEFMHVVGNFSGVDYARQAMDIDWMTREELRESIPPAYSEFIARDFLKVIA